MSEGWQTYAHKSPNFTPGAPRGRTVVVHSTRSGKRDNPNELAGTLAWFEKPLNVSAHIVIGKDGSIWRCVNDTDQAWHAMEWNTIAWGIELCQGTSDEPFTDAQYASLRQVLRHYHETFNVPLVHATRDAIDGVIGHEEIPPGLRDGKTDPGPQFDWSRAVANEDDDTTPWALGQEGEQLIIFHNEIPVLKLGDVEGKFPGQLAKLFGETYFWLLKTADNLAVWSEIEGD